MRIFNDRILGVKKMISIVMKTIILLGASVILFMALARIIIINSSHPNILPIDGQPKAQVALVFGAGLRRDGSPTAILRDRLQSAAELYKSGKVEKLLLSGDNSYLEYNEPGAMREFAISLGVPADDIVLDYAGRRTYDSCYRAQEIFGIQTAILVTQPFHLPRAVYTCRALGMDATGYPAQNINYLKRSQIYWNIREIPAMLMAFVDVHITHPIPILGEKEPIFPD